eukprot:COSAG05_NODE_1439_length_4884_cov_11.725065_1_plen_402_part_00
MAMPGASFHGESVEAMVRACVAGSWTAPPLPPQVGAALADPTLTWLTPNWSAGTCGVGMRAQCFGLDPSWTFVNHGAFGAPCQLGAVVAQAWRQHTELQPLQFIDRELFAHLVESTRAVSDWVGAPTTELVLLPNATTGLNTVIHSLVSGGQSALSAGDEVLYLDVGYGSVKTMLERACRQSGVTPVQAPILDLLPAPDLSPSELVDAILERVEAGMTANTRLLILDDITSNTALRLPTEQILALCRGRGVMSLVDAAHTVGSNPSARIPWLGAADFACGNLHKWGCGPRGTAFMCALEPHPSYSARNNPPFSAFPFAFSFMGDYFCFLLFATWEGGLPHWRCGNARYAKEEHQHMIEPPVLSHGYGAGFTSGFIWSGAADYRCGAPTHTAFVYFRLRVLA